MMAERAKTIKGLRLCLGSIDSADCPAECPYVQKCSEYEKRVVFQPVMRDALALLEEKEAVPVTITDSDGGQSHWYVCGSCKAPINPGDKYCHECGKMVKWDG